jgi:hypothetical protein
LKKRKKAQLELNSEEPSSDLNPKIQNSAAKERKTETKTLVGNGNKEN